MKIKEKDISIIKIIDDTEAMTIFNRVNGGGLYSSKYFYGDLDSYYRYCEYCGELYDQNETHCPFCDETTRYLDTKDVIDCVYSLMNDGCVVEITFADGTTKRFEL